MGLHDRLHRQNGSTPGAPGDALDALSGQQSEVTERRPDPYADLKTRIHHACIAKLGPQLFSAGKSHDGAPVDLAEAHPLADIGHRQQLEAVGDDRWLDVVE